MGDNPAHPYPQSGTLKLPAHALAVRKARTQAQMQAHPSANTSKHCGQQSYSQQYAQAQAKQGAQKPNGAGQQNNPSRQTAEKQGRGQGAKPAKPPVLTGEAANRAHNKKQNAQAKQVKLDQLAKVQAVMARYAVIRECKPLEVGIHKQVLDLPDWQRLGISRLNVRNWLHLHCNDRKYKHQLAADSQRYPLV